MGQTIPPTTMDSEAQSLGLIVEDTEIKNNVSTAINNVTESIEIEESEVIPIVPDEVSSDKVESQVQEPEEVIESNDEVILNETSDHLDSVGEGQVSYQIISDELSDISYLEVDSANTEEELIEELAKNQEELVFSSAMGSSVFGSSVYFKKSSSNNGCPKKDKSLQLIKMLSSEPHNLTLEEIESKTNISAGLVEASFTQECWTLFIPRLTEALHRLLADLDSPLSMSDTIISQSIDRVRELVIDRPVMEYKYIIGDLVYLYIQYYRTYDEDKIWIKEQIDKLTNLFRRYPRFTNNRTITVLDRENVNATFDF